ncbi:MAG: hypothetical protein IPL31_13185 [Saprospiraceae bacterium]|nr:hypothetical protein [Saprospiraceae bacterium]
MTQIKIFGIRHHGAGSTKRLLQALDQFQPDVLAIELPEEAKQLIPLINEQTIVPPIAFLFYDANNPDHSIYLPLAVFSPEYQAILFSIKHTIPIFPIDLPAGISMQHSNFSASPEADLDKRQKSMIHDPIGFLAKQAGYKDSERWWEIHFEQWTDHDKLFDFIQNLMGELRHKSLGLDDSETLIREQFMRIQLRKLIQKKFKKIAVICGAWHGPLLIEEELKRTEEETLKSLKTTNIKTCIIPWTYKNMSLENGYSAGIQSPIWHEALFNNAQNASSEFLVKAIHYLRKEGIDLSPASAMDAEMLATNLALIRNLPFPGLEELLESANCVFGKGSLKNSATIREHILCGEVTGKIEIGKQSLPFIICFHEALRKLRLTRFWKDGHQEHLDLDLRKENHLLISQFLHFTQLVELNWVNTKVIEVNALGNFHENWWFHWRPELEIQLIQIALCGNSLREAALKYLIRKLNGPIEFYKIGQFLDSALKSGFHEVLPLLKTKIENIILQNADVIQLSTMIRPLLSGMDYGAIHQTDLDFIKSVLETLISKIVIAFPEAVHFVDAKRSKMLLEVLFVIQLYFDKFKQHDLASFWKEQLAHIISDDLAHPLIKGKIWNLMLERKWTGMDEFIHAFDLQFSLHSEIPQAAQWFEGFLYNQSAFYLMHPDILRSLDFWIQSLDEIHFNEYLPLLRRTLDSITPGERQRIFKLLKNQTTIKIEEPEVELFIDLRRVSLIEKYLEKLSN